MCYSNKIDTNAAVGAHFVQCVSGRAILMQTTKTRMWGKGTLTKSWKRWVNIIVKINNAFCGLVCVCKFICKEWDIYIYFFQKIKVSFPPPCIDGCPDDTPGFSCCVAQYTVHLAILSTFLCLGV